MKNTKKIKTILIIICAILIVGLIGYGVFKVIDKGNNDRKERQKREREIVKNFESFKDAALSFGDESIEYRSWIKDDINENTIHSYDGWILSLDTMNSAIEEMEKTAPMFKKNCVNKKYSNKDVQEKCDSFMETYEEIINTFVVDVEDFNTKIVELKEKTKNEDLKEYELKYKKVDLNNDKVYSEIIMEDVEEEETEE
ncbi:MAG: hypothetical protein IKP79_00530 [Bacilli bacterium]|nr:hypothetical protein [Bacilli bacterium]